jgi:opacity protein-like surface antigen
VSLAAYLSSGVHLVQAQDLPAVQDAHIPELIEGAPGASSLGMIEFSAQPLVLSDNQESSSPGAAAFNESSLEGSAPEKHPVDSELIAEGEGSFGHYHIFAYSWWSELYTGGVEYDRHTWNYFLKSQMDYVAEVLPVAILRQPADTDVFGDPLSQSRVINPGLGIYPVGLRMKWRYDKGWEPYFTIKGGMLFFAQKALSKDAAHQNFSLQMGLGMQRRLTKHLDMRVGYEDIHFSDAFMVPSNPGLDVMACDGGVVYRLGK